MRPVLVRQDRTPEIGRPARETQNACVDTSRGRRWPRLSLVPDGRVLYALRHRFRDGTTHVAFEPLDFVAKLAALVPPPRFNMVPITAYLPPRHACGPAYGRI